MVARTRTNSTKTPEEAPRPELELALPRKMKLPPDRLRARLDVYQSSVIVQTFDGNSVTTKYVSPDQVAMAITRGMDRGTGLLPPDALWWRNSKEGPVTALWRPSKVWRVAVQDEPFKPPIRLALPMPGLVFICSPSRPPWVFAMAGRPAAAHDVVFRCPTYNIFRDGRVCPGSHKFPAEVTAIPESFFAAYFSRTGDFENRSKKHKATVRSLWDELDGKEEYPVDDLVKDGRTLDEIMGVP